MTESERLGITIRYNERSARSIKLQMRRATILKAAAESQLWLGIQLKWPNLLVFGCDDSRRGGIENRSGIYMV